MLLFWKLLFSQPLNRTSGAAERGDFCLLGKIVLIDDCQIIFDFDQTCRGVGDTNAASGAGDST